MPQTGQSTKGLIEDAVRAFIGGAVEVLFWLNAGAVLGGWTWPAGPKRDTGTGCGWLMRRSMSRPTQREDVKSHTTRM